MDKWLDLHMHSVLSNDGEFSTEELLRKCIKAGLKTVAIADHNSVRCVALAKRFVKDLDLIYLPAVELDCSYKNKNFHLLGYGIHANASVFAKIDKDVHFQEVEASSKLIELVKKMGFFFDEKQVYSVANNGVVIGENIAEAVLADSRNNENKMLVPFRAGGARSDNPLVNFYWDFCSQGKPAHSPMQYMSMDEAVKAIQENGGAAVLAHPGANVGENIEIVKDIIKLGLDGIEVYSSYHDKRTQEIYAEICRQENIIATIGSDFHGKAKPSIQLGEMEMPNAQDMYNRLKQKIQLRGGEIIV